MISLGGGCDSVADLWAVAATALGRIRLGHSYAFLIVATTVIAAAVRTRICIVGFEC